MIARGRALAERLLDAGEPAALVARRLGIARETLAKWVGEPAGRPTRSRAPTAGAGFLRVGLKAPPAHQERELEGATNAVRLISPRGYRLEGLDAATAVAILREVG
jgi:transposase-like protein